MSTRQEELQNLKTIYSAITQIEKLEERISKKEELIEEQKARYVEEYPEYYSNGHEAMAQAKIDSQKERRNKILSCIFVLPAIAFLVYEVILLLQTGEEGFFDIAIWCAAYLASLIFALYPKFGLLISGACHLAVAGLWKAFGDSGAELYSKLNLMSGILLVALSVIWIISFLICIPSQKKKANKILAVAREKEEKDFQEYEKNKAEANVEIERKKVELSKEVASIIAKEKEEIEKLKNDIATNQRIIATTPGLSPQDKNLYTVSTLINYFERGKADSIKEAINIFDLEEREKARDLERRTAQFIADMERKAALDRMEREQREYNQAILDSTRRMEQEQKEHNEKIQKELDDIKNGR